MGSHGEFLLFSESSLPCALSYQCSKLLPGGAEMTTATVSSKGQIVLPKQLRDELSIREGDRVEISREQDHIVLRLIEDRGTTSDWRRWRGVLSGSDALEEHLREHREEVAADRLP
jgi:AbrB family looped-hinge helix DNA binding protein